MRARRRSSSSTPLAMSSTDDEDSPDAEQVNHPDPRKRVGTLIVKQPKGELVIDIRKQPDQLYIAGLIDTESGKEYYYDASTGVTSWGRPKQNRENICDTQQEEQVWLRLEDEKGCPFEYNPKTCESRWVFHNIDVCDRESQIRDRSIRPGRQYVVYDKQSAREYVYDRDQVESYFADEIPEGGTVALVVDEDQLEDEIQTVDDRHSVRGSTASQGSMGYLTENEIEEDEPVHTEAKFDEGPLLEALTLIRAIHEASLRQGHPFFEQWPTYETFLHAFADPTKHYHLLVVIHRMVMSNNSNEPDELRKSFVTNGISRFRRHWLESLYNAITGWALKTSPAHIRHKALVDKLLGSIQPSLENENSECPFRLPNQRSDPRPLYSELPALIRTKILLAMCKWGEALKDTWIETALSRFGELARAQFLGNEISTGGRLFRFPNLSPYRLYRELDSRMIVLSTDIGDLKIAVEAISAKEPATSKLHTVLARTLHDLGLASPPARGFYGQENRHGAQGVHGTFARHNGNSNIGSYSGSYASRPVAPNDAGVYAGLISQMSPVGGNYYGAQSYPGIVRPIPRIGQSGFISYPNSGASTSRLSMSAFSSPPIMLDRTSGLFIIGNEFQQAPLGTGSLEGELANRPSGKKEDQDEPELIKLLQEDSSPEQGTSVTSPQESELSNATDSSPLSTEGTEHVAALPWQNNDKKSFASDDSLQQPTSDIMQLPSSSESGVQHENGLATLRAVQQRNEANTIPGHFVTQAQEFAVSDSGSSSDDDDDDDKVQVIDLQEDDNLDYGKKRLKRERRRLRKLQEQAAMALQVAAPPQNS